MRCAPVVDIPYGLGTARPRPRLWGTNDVGRGRIVGSVTHPPRPSTRPNARIYYSLSTYDVYEKSRANITPYAYLAQPIITALRRWQRTSHSRPTLDCLIQ